MKKFPEISKVLESGPVYFLEDLSKKGLNKYPTFKYSKLNNSWIDVSNQNSDIIKTNTISFISYNVWFENVNWDNRLKNLFQIFETYSPDYICLQEVTEGFLRDLIRNNFVKDNYCFSGNFRGGYDILILSKYKSKFYSQQFTSGMGRNLLITEINHSNDNKKFNNIMISTSHFESLNNAYLRKEQLKISFEILYYSNNAFLMGDFNFDS
jgi:tyrosyl-DNA phosphodiesterase 2